MALQRSARDPRAPYQWPGPTVQGGFDATVQQTALYDFLAGGIVSAVLLLLERRRRFDGFFVSAFVLLYGAGRFVSDFARLADKNLIGTLTGSQLTVVAAAATVMVWAALRRPWRRELWAWQPPDFPHGWGVTEPPAPDGGVEVGAPSPLKGMPREHVQDVPRLEGHRRAGDRRHRHLRGGAGCLRGGAPAAAAGDLPTVDDPHDEDDERRQRRAGEP